VARDGGSVLVFCGSKRNVRRTAQTLAYHQGQRSPGALRTAGVRPTILLGGGLAALSCLFVFIPSARDPERPGYQPHPGHDAPTTTTP
jgi:hypothetical protein